MDGCQGSTVNYGKSMKDMKQGADAGALFHGKITLGSVQPPAACAATQAAQEGTPSALRKRSFLFHQLVNA